MSINNEKIKIRLEEIRDTVRIIKAEKLMEFILGAMMGYIHDHEILKDKFYEVAKNAVMEKSEEGQQAVAFRLLYELEEERKQQAKPPDRLMLKNISGMEDMLADIRFYQERRIEKTRESAAQVCNELIFFLQRVGRIIVKDVEVDPNQQTVVYKEIRRTFRSGGLPWSLILRAANKDPARKHEPIGETE